MDTFVQGSARLRQGRGVFSGRTVQREEEPPPALLAEVPASAAWSWAWTCPGAWPSEGGLWTGEVLSAGMRVCLSTPGLLLSDSLEAGAASVLGLPALRRGLGTGLCSGRHTVSSEWGSGNTASD